MDSEFSAPLRIDVRKSSYCCCSCSLIQRNYSSSWKRSVKRKLDEFEDGDRFLLPGFDYSSIARVEIENECTELREMVNKQQQLIQNLYAELEEERSASASAANEAMSMMLRLQREKAESQMEARQFKLFTEEKILHDQEEILALEDLLYKREQEIQSLSFEVQAYKHRMLSYGIEVEGGEEHIGDECYDYPPLKCNENHAFSEAPEHEDLTNMEGRLCQMEGTPRSCSTKHVLEKVIVDQSPIEDTFDMKEPDSFSETGDDVSDRVYMIDSIHDRVPYNSVKEPKSIEEDLDSDIKILHMRLQALEADRESMRQELISMRTDKAQLFLLREIAQRICKEGPLQVKMPIMKEPLIRKFSIMGIFKWIMSFIFWRRHARQNRLTIDLSRNMGLLMLLDKAPHMK